MAPVLDARDAGPRPVAGFRHAGLGAVLPITPTTTTVADLRP
jgi:hypothetical protein